MTQFTIQICLGDVYKQEGVSVLQIAFKVLIHERSHDQVTLTFNAVYLVTISICCSPHPIRFQVWFTAVSSVCVCACAYLSSLSSASNIGFCWFLSNGGWEASSCCCLRRCISCKISLKIHNLLTLKMQIQITVQYHNKQSHTHLFLFSSSAISCRCCLLVSRQREMSAGTLAFC